MSALLMENSTAGVSAIWYSYHILLISTCQLLLFPEENPQLYFCILRNTKQFNIKSWYVCKIEIDISRPTLKHKVQVIFV